MKKPSQTLAVHKQNFSKNEKACLFQVVFLTLLIAFTIPLFADGTLPPGAGTEPSPYQVSTLDHLLWITTNSGSWNKYFEQTADIDASSTSSWNSGEGWLPIGGVFSGHYNGQNHTISSLYINRPSTDNVGLFKQTDGATISNLGLTSVNITGRTYVGAFSGYNTSNVTMNNIYSTGTVTGSMDAAGLVGGNCDNSSINNSFSTCTVSGSDFVFGGLVGWNNSSASVSNSYSTGSVSGPDYVGGLVGYNYNGATVSNSYSTGPVTMTGASIKVGGLVGYLEGGTVENSFWDKETSTKTSSYGGTAKTTVEMKNVRTFTDVGWSEGLASAWDFETNPYDDAANNNYWDMDYSETINNGYPYLSWKDGGDVSLPVELSAFTVKNHNGGVLLEWSTESEVENLGFIVERRAAGEITFTEITDFRTNSALKGQGSTTRRHNYQYCDNNVISGMTYEYRLSDVSYNGTVVRHSIHRITVKKEISDAVPEAFTLHNACPNPFNPITTIAYQIAKPSLVRLSIYNINGRLVETLVSDHKNAGYHSVEWNASSVSSGIYVYRIDADNFSSVKKCLLVK